jgi:beta-N-acetylhexosaminidase
MTPRAAILGCAGPQLGAEERRFFGRADPLGFILFARNVEAPEQLRALVQDLRAAVGRQAPILIDQEGGRVQRLRPPHWRQAPPAAAFGLRALSDRAAAREAARLNARLIAGELADVGIDTVCAPVLDVRHPGAHDVIGDRAFSEDPDIVIDLGRAASAGFAEGGVLPVIKHLPGHGRSRVDSHLQLPVVDASLAELEASDFRPFRALADNPLGMTGHLLIAAVDGLQPATLSARVITEVIRGRIGFGGILITDDLSMGALAGPVEARAAAALAAGCDIALHCNGRMEEMAAVAAGVPAISADVAARLAKARSDVSGSRPWADAAGDRRRLGQLLEGSAHV